MVFIYFVSVCELGLYRSHVHIIWSRCRRSVIKSLPVDMLSQALLLLSIMKSRQELPMSFFFQHTSVSKFLGMLLFSLLYVSDWGCATRGHIYYLVLFSLMRLASSASSSQTWSDSGCHLAYPSLPHVSAMLCHAQKSKQHAVYSKLC